MSACLPSNIFRFELAGKRHFEDNRLFSVVVMLSKEVSVLLQNEFEMSALCVG